MDWGGDGGSGKHLSLDSIYGLGSTSVFVVFKGAGWRHRSLKITRSTESWREQETG